MIESVSQAQRLNMFKNTDWQLVSSYYEYLESDVCVTQPTTHMERNFLNLCYCTDLLNLIIIIFRSQKFMYFYSEISTYTLISSLQSIYHHPNIWAKSQVRAWPLNLSRGQNLLRRRFFFSAESKSSNATVTVCMQWYQKDLWSLKEVETGWLEHWRVKVGWVRQ